MPVKIAPDSGTICHVAFGILGPLFHSEHIFSAIFVLKQCGDYLFSKEEWAESAGDITEYCIGMITGLVLRTLLAT